MKSLHKYSLRTKIIILLLISATVFLSLFQVISYYSLKKQLLHELNEVADQKIDRLSRDLEIPMWELDDVWIKKILQSELMDDRTHAIIVSGAENILVSLDRDRDYIIKKHENENVIIRTHPILHNGTKIGEVDLYVTKRLMDESLYHGFLNSIVATFFEIIVIIFVLWIMLKRLILFPIQALVVSTECIANGDYAHSPLDLQDDEIGALGMSIYRMENNIQLREEELLLTNSSLAALKEQHEFAISGTQDGLWDWNIETSEVYFSPRWKEMIGYTDSELTNSFETWEERVHPDDIQLTKNDIRMCHSNEGYLYANTHRLRHKNGSWIWVLARAKTIFNEDGKAIRMAGFHTDITRQKELEKELFEKEEMMIAQSRHVAMGEMIGMIAHQWRQPITVIAMGVNNMLADIALESVEIENFKYESQQILKQTEYLSKTIDDFRTFFRPNKDKDEIKVIDIFQEAKQIIGKSLENSNINLVLVDNTNESILTYSRELLQVVLNLLKNAKEALEAKNIQDAYIHVNIESFTDTIVTTVCDNGGGIDMNLLERIFEPYFSTKDVKTGTGLGLYMSKIIIEKHLGGTLEAINRDMGACFIITLPKFFNGESENE